MKALLLVLLLAGCSLIPEDRDWEPSGHHYLGGMVSANGSSMGPVHLYRPNPDEKPQIERVEVSDGRFIEVKVWPYKCAGGDVESAYALDDIYLCNRPSARPHELCHKADYEHTDWVHTGVAACATVTRAGYKCGAPVGATICVANGHEWVDK